MIYFVVFLYLLFGVIIYDTYEKKRYFKFHYAVLYVLFTLIAGVRWRLGVDTVNYMHYFAYDMLPLSELSLKYIVESKFQPFWLLLNALCKSIDSFTLLQILTSAFFHGAVFCFFYRCCRKPFTALSIFFIYNYFYFSMEIMRESLAISCFLFGVMALDKGSPSKYYVWALCAFMFHFFAIFLLFLPFCFRILKKENSLGRYILIVVLAFFAWINFKEVILLQVINLFPLNMSYKVLGLVSGAMSTNSWNIKGLMYNMFPLFIIITFLYFYRRGTCKDLFVMRKKHVWLSCVLLYAVVLLICLDMPIIHRFSNYVYLMVIILYSSCMYAFCLNRRTQAVFVSFCLLCMLGIRVYLLTRPDCWFDGYHLRIHPYAAYYPYTSVFDKRETRERQVLHSYWGDQ